MTLSIAGVLSLTVATCLMMLLIGSIRDTWRKGLWHAPRYGEVGSDWRPRRSNSWSVATRGEYEKVKPHVKVNATNRFNANWLPAKPDFDSQSRASRILIVDDDASTRLGFRVALEAAGYETSEAEDGEQALEELRADPADLVLLDLRMPLLDGTETLRSLREERIDVPVVIVTGHGGVRDAVEAVRLGAVDFLTKPVDPASLRRTVTGLLMGRTSRGAPHDRITETLAVARKALRQGQHALAEALLQRMLHLDPDSPRADTLLGELHESLGEFHSAYRSYRSALLKNRRHGPALDGMKRYCDRMGLDFNNVQINPGA
jgi:DNA-binding response OmpR family regulator